MHPNLSTNCLTVFQLNCWTQLFHQTVLPICSPDGSNQFSHFKLSNFAPQNGQFNCVITFSNKTFLPKEIFPPNLANYFFHTISNNIPPPHSFHPLFPTIFSHHFPKTFLQNFLLSTVYCILHHIYCILSLLVHIVTKSLNMWTT